MKSGKTIIRGIVFCISIVGMSMLCSACGEKEPEALQVEYFYYNTCASCEPEKEFYEDFESIAGISQVTSDVKIKTYNVFTDDGEKVWKKVAKKMKLSEEPDFPVLLIENEIIYISDTPTEEKLENKKVEILTFISADCSACTEAGDNVISNIPEKVPIAGVDIDTSVRVITLITNDDKVLFKKYCRAYHVKEEMQTTPIVFVGKAALSGNDEISKLQAFISNVMALETISVQ